MQNGAECVRDNPKDMLRRLSCSHPTNRLLVRQDSLQVLQRCIHVQALVRVPPQLTTVGGRLQVLDFRKRMQKLAGALGVDRSVQQEAQALVEQVSTSWSSQSRMPRAGLLAATCLFIVSRLHEVPLTIINVALEAQVSISISLQSISTRRVQFIPCRILCDA